MNFDPNESWTNFWMRHSVFLRFARDAAHQALFFIGMLDETKGEPYAAAVKKYWKPAMHQVKGLVRGVYISGVYASVEKLLKQEERPKTQVKLALSLAGKWRNIADGLKDENVEQIYPLEKVPKLRQELAQFLRDSKATEPWNRWFSHTLPNILRWLGKHLALLLATLLVLGVSLKVGVVNGLLRNEGWRIWIYVALLSFPFLVVQQRAFKLRRSQGHIVHPWNIGGAAFWRLRPLAIGPGRLIQRWTGSGTILRIIVRGQLFKTALYLGWPIIAFVIAFAIATIADSDSTPTAFIVIWLFYLFLIAANQLDFWDFIFSAPIRFLGIFLAIVCLVGLYLGFGRETFVALFLLIALGLVLYYLLTAQKGWAWILTAGFFAVLGVALIIGGMTHQKEIWQKNSRVDRFVRLSDRAWPYPSSEPVVVIAASGGGSRAAVYTALTLKALNEDKELREVAAGLQAISSVSGGSLANAAYVARLMRSGLVDDTGVNWGERSKALSDLDQAVSDDFLLPTLLGALIPGTTRGKTIEKAWQGDPVALQKHSLGDLAERWREAKDNRFPTPPFPIPLFNTTTLDAHDLVISPIEKRFYILRERHTEAQSQKNKYTPRSGEANPPEDPFTWVFYRDGIYGLEDLLEDRDLLLSSAVRASAAFPFGFPVVKVKPAAYTEGKPRPLFFSPKPNREDVKLTDGGALSNSGLWSMFHLLRNMHPQLYQRGVLLIIIEASKMPEYRSVAGSYNRLIGTIGNQDPIGRDVHERMLDVLEMLYGRRLAVVQIDLIPRESYNVMTTWALDKRSLDLLRESFNTIWQQQRPNIVANWHALKEDKPTADSMIDRRRPPLD